MTPDELYTVIRNQCAESSTEFWTESEIYSLISMGERILAQRAGLIETNSAFTSVTDTKTYGIASNLCANIGTIIRIEYDSYRLEGITLNNIDEVEGKAYGGVTLTGQPKYYYRHGGELGFSPTPDDAKEVKVYFLENPAEITTASTAFSIDSEYAPYIEDYALYRMFLKDDELRDIAKAYRDQWYDNINHVINDWNNRKGLDNIHSVTVVEGFADE